MADVFLSYAHEDSDFAENLAAVLQDCGLTVWWDRKVLPGMEFSRLIEEQIAIAGCALVLWSKHSTHSDWVGNEAGRAHSLGKFIPVLLENVTLSIPLEFSRISAADLTSWAGNRKDPRFIALLEAIRTGIRRENATPVREKRLQRQPPVILSGQPARRSAKVERGVLVLVGGGNACLAHAKEAWRGVEQVSIETIREQVLGPGREVLVLEGAGGPTEVPVKFADLRHAAHSLAEELDSTQMQRSLWGPIADYIFREAHKYEGFVVLHGLDAMAYTASAISFMLANLSFPIVFTGAQCLLDDPRSDAIINIRGAVTIAAGRSLGIRPLIPEVCVLLGTRLLRGNRTTIIDISAFEALGSPGLPPLATLSRDVRIDASLVRRLPGIRRLELRSGDNARVAIVDLFPGIHSFIEELAVSSSRVDGVLLRIGGTGTVRPSPAVFAAIDRLLAAGVFMVAVNQPGRQRVGMQGDPFGLALLERGVLIAEDLTSEAAYAKMIVILSEGLRGSIAMDRFSTAICGEQSRNALHLRFGAGRTEFEGSVCSYLAGPRGSTEYLRALEEDLLLAELRLLGVSIEGDEAINRSVDFEAQVVDLADLISVELLTRGLLRWSRQGERKINVIYNITAGIHELLAPKRGLRIETSEPVVWCEISVVLYTTRATTNL